MKFDDNSWEPDPSGEDDEKIFDEPECGEDPRWYAQATH